MFCVLPCVALARKCGFFFSSRRRHTRSLCDGVQTCALPIYPITLKYDDTAPYDGVDYPAINNINGVGTNDGWRVMKLCGSDPRPNPDTSPFDLGGNTPAMPASDPTDGPHTSCMLQSTDSAGTGPNFRTYDAWIFSNVDGGRTY